MALYFFGVMILCLNAALLGQEPTGPDPLQQLQSEAITNKTSPLAWWLCPAAPAAGGTLAI